MTSTHVGEGCRESEVAQARAVVTRRNLLKGMLVGAGTLALPPTLITSTVSVAYAVTPGYTGDTLVVLSLRGGFDGLNAVVPSGDPDYLTHRPGIGIPAAATLRLDSRFGLHPALAPLKALYDSDKLAVVHATGLAEPNRSHFAAMDEIEQATPGTPSRSGWLARALALHDSDGPFNAVQIGSTDMPYELVGDFPTLGMNSLDSFDINGVDDESRPRWDTALRALHSGADPIHQRSASMTLDALSTAQALAATTYVPAHGATYPSSDLGRALTDVARMIKANTGIRVATIDYGDWDMHSGMGTVGSGWMHDHLTDFGAALAAFVADLGTTMDDVTLVTISEFGRRVGENDSMGVDHGWGNAMFVLGGHVNAAVHGTWPTLAEAALTDGDLTVTTDYRAVLADILVNRCQVDTAGATTVFPHFTGANLGVTIPRG
ncbi:MAG: DUF1501 domain-containing protein [Actinobacteria bacterium]|uniref:Unannotated protein n=1 Tax=freshwater metagenome TaxID=449393 RepID=A0A6J7QHT1_9ZZZZ|nr:DUF1501 domain-containing protein [Actinomycetota bacterium]